VEDDDELMLSYVAGDIGAFDDLYRRYAARVLVFLTRGLSREEAADLLQQTFLLLHRSRSDFRPGAGVRPWLFTIAINVKRQHLRNYRRRRENTAQAESAPAFAMSHVYGDDLAGRVRAAWAELQYEQREVIRLHFMEGLSFREIAEAAGTTVNAVKVRAHRGYVQLRQRFAKDE
jgi:RNA polymerase sigma factor (sigma-70 family)